MAKARSKKYLGFDLGASSGRAVLGVLENNKLSLHEIHRFTNGPVQLGQTLFWDFPFLWSNIVESLRICAKHGHTRLAGIGVDTWGVDFGLIGPDGNLLGNPVHYRDYRTEGMEKIIAGKMKNLEVYRLSGLGIGRVTTLAQFVAIRRGPSRFLFDVAKSFLMMSDLFRYFLCGDRSCELTAVGSSALSDVRAEKWSAKIFKTFDLPLKIMSPIVKPGTVVGDLRPAIARDTGIVAAPVIATAGHDTACAAAAVPFVDNDTAFVSSGTWFCMGIINDGPITTEEALKAGYINEFGLDSMLFVKNLVGLYLVENLRRAWIKRGLDIKYSDMIHEAAQAKPFHVLIDSNAPMFFTLEDTEAAVREYLRKTRQAAAASRGQLIRGILEGLALNFRQALIDLAKMTGRTFKRFCIVGGGVHNTLLCQMTADATGLEVVAGPTEATAAGNLAIQALATKALKKPADIRTLVRNSFKLTSYTPRSVDNWAREADRYAKIVERGR